MIEFAGVGLSKRNAEGVVPILRDVSFQVPPETVYAILGPSGAGKSTVLRLACRLEDPDAGRIFLSGEDVREFDVLDLRRRVGMVFQEAVLFGETVEEDLRFAADPNDEGRTLDDPAEWLERVGLPREFLTRAPASLSVGQRQRAAFARALIPGPEALLLDEPTSALDPQASAGLLRLVRELRDELKLTVIFVSHAIEHARAVADRVLVLKDGAVLEEGGPELFGKPRREETRAFLAGEEEE